MLKIFELRWPDDEVAWIAAYTNVQALQIYCTATDTDFHDLEGDEEIKELPPNKWRKIYVTDEDALPSQSLHQWMQDNQEPALIAGSIWN
jgi:hypothetical protein